MDDCTKPTLLLNTIGNHIDANASNQYGAIGSVSNMDGGDEPRMTVINGGFIRENRPHMDITNINTTSNQTNVATATTQSINFEPETNNLRGNAHPPVPMEKAKRIDVTARILFPLIFATFNLAYWLNYLLQAQSEFQAILQKNDSQNNSAKS